MLMHGRRTSRTCCNGAGTCGIFVEGGSLGGAHMPGGGGGSLGVVAGAGGTPGAGPGNTLACIGADIEAADAGIASADIDNGCITGPAAFIVLGKGKLGVSDTDRAENPGIATW